MAAETASSKRPRPMNAPLIPANERRVGRVAGVPNKSTRALKEAIVLAAEQSVHSETKDLVGYVKYLADKKPEIFASLLCRLLPLQVRAKAGEIPVNRININMPVQEMVNKFEQRIKSAYMPALAPSSSLIEHDEDDA